MRFKSILSSRSRDIEKSVKSQNLEYSCLRQVMTKKVSFQDRKKENAPKFASKYASKYDIKID